ncbi:MAG: hypothetical protein CMP47_05845 [Rickettsiales bacterium]|nr:hypothetical protein [Rickettsiales bacterium]
MDLQLKFQYLSRCLNLLASVYFFHRQLDSVDNFVKKFWLKWYKPDEIDVFCFGEQKISIKSFYNNSLKDQLKATL